MHASLHDEAHEFFRKMEAERDGGRISEAEYQQRCKQAYEWLHSRGFSFMWRKGEELPAWAVEVERESRSSFDESMARMREKAESFLHPN